MYIVGSEKVFFGHFENISIFSNCNHIEWRSGLMDMILKGNHPVPCMVSYIRLISSSGEDFLMIFLSKWV